jgi:hypothetical protein
MTRLSGQPLAHGIEGFAAGTSLVGQLQRSFNLPAILARTIDHMRSSPIIVEIFAALLVHLLIPKFACEGAAM